MPESTVLPEHPPAEIAEMLAKFKEAGINNIVWDPSIVRGFAYYTGLVFEVFDTHADNNRAIAGGGRYDNLTALFDDEPLPGVGFAIGDATMRDFLEVRGLLPAYVPKTQLYIATPSPELAYDVQSLAGELRRAGLNVAIDFGERKLGDQIKAATKHKIPWLMVAGSDEFAKNEFTLRNLDTGHEETMPLEQLAAFVLGQN